jgi:3-aminobutyryl-CoA ammonia-lyase
MAGTGRREEEAMTDQPVSASIRIRVGTEDAHYGSIAAGAFVMKLFGDLATEITVRHDGDEGLLRAYEKVEFLAPVRPGDFLECRAALVRVGTTSRTFEAEAWRVIDARPDLEESAVDLLDEPVLVARATGTTVVLSSLQRKGAG